MPSLGKDIDPLELSYIADDNVKENNFFQKIKLF